MNKDNEPKQVEQSGALVPAAQFRSITAAEYLREARARLKKDKHKAAYVLLQEAVLNYPDDPYLLSYYGYLQASVDRRYRIGIETCLKAMTIMKKQDLSGEEIHYHVAYLNLGRAYVAAGRKKEGIDAFRNGLKYDNRNADLLKEVRAQGIRKNPVLTFLDRSNPINKYLGMLLHSGGKKQKKK